MAEKRRFLDVWILESNTVYREVPFTVVSDWVQQGRLLENDRLRPSGTSEWFSVGASPDFTPYLPRAEPYRVDDQAEALEPVELDFRWKKPAPDEDDDVDMIPLIDVSLVLLIFFMLTASGAGMAAFVPTPAAEYGSMSPNSEDLQVNINLDEDRPIFSLTVSNRPLSNEDSNLQTVEQLLDRLRVYLEGHRGNFDITINGHGEIESGLTLDLMAALEKPPFRGRITAKFLGVSEKLP